MRSVKIWFYLISLICTAVLLFSQVQAQAECYDTTVNFDSNQGYSWNHNWSQCLTNLPSNCTVESAEIEVRAQVWYWGWYPYEQDILASDTISFNYSDGYVCSIDSSTHPSSSNFYTTTCDLNINQLPWLFNDNCINFMMVTFGGTYYLDHATLTICCSDLQACPGDFDSDADVDGSDLATFAEDFGRTDCSNDCEGDFDGDNDVDGSDLAVFAADFGRTDCP